MVINDREWFPSPDGVKPCDWLYHKTDVACPMARSPEA